MRQSSADAVAVLVSLMMDSEQKSEIRIKVAESILDRVCGKASSGGGEAEVAGNACVSFEGVLEEWSR